MVRPQSLKQTNVNTAFRHRRTGVHRCVARQLPSSRKLRITEGPELLVLALEMRIPRLILLGSVPTPFMNAVEGQHISGIVGRIIERYPRRDTGRFTLLASHANGGIDACAVLHIGAPFAQSNYPTQNTTSTSSRKPPSSNYSPVTRSIFRRTPSVPIEPVVTNVPIGGTPTPGSRKFSTEH